MKKHLFILSFIFTHLATAQETQTIWLSTMAEKKDIPASILALDSRTQDMDDRQKYEITVGIINDNQWINDSTSDDRGHTYGHFLRTSVITERGLRLTFSYSGDLYTQDDGKFYKNSEGRTTYIQNTIEESVIKFVIDNAEQGRLLYYRAGAGWHLLDGSGQGPAATAQVKFHNLVKELRQPINIESNYKQSAVLAEFAVGIQKTQTVNSNLKFEEKVEIGTRYSGIKNASHLMADTSASLLYQPNFTNGFGVKLTTGINVKTYEIGTELTPYAGFDVTYKKSASCGVKLSKTQNSLVNYQLYNLPNRRTGEIDSLWTASCEHKF